MVSQTMILAFGCSVAHGIDTATTGNSEENLSHSYPNLIAKHLKVHCESWAFAGNSNENMFYQFMENIPQFNKEEITAVIVGWTSPVRDVWVCEGRTWQFIPNWCYTNNDIFKPILFLEDPKVNTPTTPRLCSDREEYMTVLENFYDNLMRYKFDIKEYIKKRQCYIIAIRNYCQLHKIKLIETCWDGEIEGVDINIGLISPWAAECRHPTKEEHVLVAKQIINHYKL